MSANDIPYWIYLYLIREHPEIIAGIAAGIGLYFTAKTFRHQQKQASFVMAENIDNDLRDLQKELAKISPKGPAAIVGINSKADMEDWDSRFFNLLEWLSFLINERQIKGKKIIAHFYPSIIQWYEQIFLTHATEHEKNDPKQYEELKRLYKRLKG
jgi:hypothetical protein